MSVSSMEGSPVPVDLPTKYQKLATEYAKIRSQAGVLKKAVVDEQIRSTELKENLRVRDQNLRKAEQELDSLNFRNQQLTKRVTILQDELDMVQQNSTRKGKMKHSNTESSKSVIEEELQKKISENAALMSMLQDQKDIYERERFRLVQDHEMYEHELKECKRVISTIEETKVAKIENENKILLMKLNAKEEELKKLHNEMKLFRSEGSRRNIPSSNVDLTNKLTALVQNIPIPELLTCLKNFFHYFELWYKNACEESECSKFKECIQKYQSQLQDLIEGYSSYCVNIGSDEGFLSGSDKLSTAINSYIINLENLSLTISLSDNEEVCKILKDIVLGCKRHWMQFNSALKVCSSSSVSPSESEDCVTRIADVFRSLRSTCDYFLSALNEKFKSNQASNELENEILSTLGRAGMLCGAVFKKLTENTDVLSQVIEFRPQGKQLELSSQPEQQHCCQHWKQECEQLKAAQTKKVKDLEEQISCLSGSTTPRSNNSMVQSPVDGKGEPTEVTNMFGSLTAPLIQSAELESQESEVKKYFNNRANALVADRQLAEGRLTSLRAECGVLQKRLEHSIECRLVLEASIKQAQDTINNLQEELTTTTTNYEIQLSSLSEHVANMNDKLTLQQEEIESLTFQLTTKESKKGRTK